MLKNKDIVVIGLQPWDVPIGSNCKDIAEVMCKHNRVLYVNFPIDIRQLSKDYKLPHLKKRLNYLFNKELPLHKIKNNLWNYYPPVVLVSANWIPWHGLFSLVNKFNNWLFARSIRRAIKTLGFSDFILFNDNDMFRGFYMNEFLKPSRSLYYCRDYMMAVPYWQKHGSVLEPQLIKKSDICVANSLYLADYCRKYNPSSYYVGQGCDLNMYDPDDVEFRPPADMQCLEGPVIGYVGAITSLRLNLDWIGYIATSRPGWNIVLVGPIEKNCEEVLKEYPNINILGSRPVKDLPSYIRCFDVCINPQLVNAVTIGNYPRKVDEYLAMKKPVVATDTPAMQAFTSYVYLSNNKQAFVQHIEEALRTDTPSKQDERRAFAETHTWENSVQQIYDAINGQLDAGTLHSAKLSSLPL